MNKYIIVLAVLVLQGCALSTDSRGITGAQGPQGVQGDPGASVSVFPVVVVPNDLDTIVGIENDYRVAIGQVPLVHGLGCTLYTVPAGTSQIIGATLTNVGSFTLTTEFNQPNGNASDGLNILPQALRSVYTQWFVVKCTGSLVVTDSAYYEFDLTSDDGSNLYVDGILINNDGNHAAATKSATKFLKRNVHNLELDYLEANGSQALMLNMNSVLLTKDHFYH